MADDIHPPQFPPTSPAPPWSGWPSLPMDGLVSPRAVAVSAGGSGDRNSMFIDDGVFYVSDAAQEALTAAAAAYNPLHDAERARLKTSIDTAAEAERSKYLTAGEGQAMTYQEKADEARRFALDAEPDPADYPMLSAEVGITAPTLAGVAAIVSAQRAAWQQIGAAIEAARLGAKKAVDEATTIEAAEAAAVVGWPNGAGASPAATG